MTLIRTRKRRGFLVGAIIGLALGLALLTPPARADTPYVTWTPGPGGKLYMTQDAYTPADEIGLPVAGPEDLFMTPDGVIYLADTGNGRVVRLDATLAVAAEYGKGVLNKPTGVFVDDEGTVYVADTGLNQILVFAADGSLRHQFGRPSEPLFGKNRTFLPRKVAVDRRKNLYVISEGSVQGVIQLNPDGRFIGNFAANTAQMSLRMILQRLFLSEEQLAQLVRNEAASPSNLAIDRQSMLYTITASTFSDQSIRKFTVAGRNIFPTIYGSTSFRDIHVDTEGLLVVVDGEGRIFEYDQNGTLLFMFNAHDNGDQRRGTLINPTGIARYGDTIYVLDKEKNALIRYQATAFAETVHRAMRLYLAGFYREAQPYFEQVLNYNGSFIMAYQGLADAYFKAGNYTAALTAYRYAEDRNGYSEAFWELRNAVLQQYLGPFIVAVTLAALGQSVFRRFERRHGWLTPLRDGMHRLRRSRLVDDTIFLLRFVRHPVDSFYYIKASQRGSLRFALLIYLWVIAVHVSSLYLIGFPFNPYAYPGQIRVENEIALWVTLFGLWNAANYLVSTISDGEGQVRDVVIGSAYSLVPYALFMPAVIAVSNVLTLNEVFLVSFSQQVILVWTGLMLFIMVREIHNYTISETTSNVLKTLFTMAMLALSAYILSLLFGQLFDFVSAVWQEIGLRGL
jgi:DNA-binding beta-propeller fold protein YncE